MSEPVFTIKAERHFSEEEVIRMWLNERGYVAVSREVMNILGSCDYQRAAGRGNVAIYDVEMDKYMMDPNFDLSKA